MELLARGEYNVIALEEALTRLRQGTLPPKSVVITFDDGFYDFYREAYLVLKYFEFPATVYQTTYYGDHAVPLFNLVVSYLLWRAAGRTLNVLHTHRHRTPLDETLFIWEIRQNRQWIREQLSYEAHHFCYPSGVYRSEFLPWLRSEGVISATTCNPGIASQKSNFLLLPRLLDSMTLSEVEFEGWLSGVPAFLPHRSRGHQKSHTAKLECRAKL